MSLTYREAKKILTSQEEAREVINSYRGMETLGSRLQLRGNPELILKLFEIEEDDSLVQILAHLKALYPEEWEAAQAAPAPENPGELEREEEEAAAPPPPAVAEPPPAPVEAAA